MSVAVPFCCPRCHGALAEIHAVGVESTAAGRGLRNLSEPTATDGRAERYGEGLICRGCGCEFPVTEAVPNFTGEDPFYEGRWAETDESTGGLRNLLIKKERFFVRHTRGLLGTVLDLGCGGGWKLYTRIGPVTGLDLSLASLIRARGIYASVARARLAELPFPDEAFDCVVSCDVLGHVLAEDKPKVFDEIGRVLKPGGRTIHYVEIASSDPMMRFARRFPELYQRYIIDPDGHVGMENVPETLGRFRALGLRPIEEKAVYRGLTYAGRMAQYFDNEYREKSATIAALASAARMLSSSRALESLANVGIAGLIEIADLIFPPSWAGGLLVCYEKR